MADLLIYHLQETRNVGKQTICTVVSSFVGNPLFTK